MANSPEQNNRTPVENPRRTPAARQITEPTTEASPTQRRARRRRARKIRRGAVLLGGVMALMLAAWGITSIITAGQPATTPASSIPVSASVATPQPDNTTWNFVGPVEQTIQQMALQNPDYRMIALPENGRVDMSYFSNVTFVGDSLTQGFQIYKQGIPNAHFCAYKGVGPKQIYDGSIQRRQDGEQEIPLDALVASAPANVYIQLGANAMVGLDDAGILAHYREMLAAMRAALPPETGYYVQSLTPVRPDNSPKFDMARIGVLNNLLAVMAFEENIYFLDLTEPLAGDDGFLREDYAGGDGYHLSPSGYAAWTDYLVTHTAYRPGTPYLEGSPFYLAPPPAEPVPEPVPSAPVDPAAAPADPAAAPADPAAAPVDPAAAPVDPAAAPPA